MSSLARALGVCFCCLAIAPLITLAADAEKSVDNGPLAAALRQNVSLDFQAKPLGEVIEELRKKLNKSAKDGEVNVMLDGTDDDVNNDASLRVTFKLDDAPLGVALRAMLKTLDLSLVERDNLLLITSPSRAAEILTTKVYSTASWQPPDVDDIRVDPLVEMIISAIAPTHWDEVGGFGKAHRFGGTLVVSQTEEVHRQLAGLLGLLERARTTKETTSWGIDDAQRTAIDALLERRVSLKFEKQTLPEVVARLQQEFKLPILLNKPQFGKSSIPADLRFTFEIKNAPLRSALRLLLARHKLKFYAADGVLWISGGKQEYHGTTTRVYPIGDFVDQANEDLVHEHAHADKLVELITTVVMPESWDEVGGVGTCSFFAEARCLVVLQTSDVHEEIDRTLSALRKARDAQAKSPAAAEPAPLLHTKFYSLNGPVPVSRNAISITFPPANPPPKPIEAKDLVDFICQRISPESWKSDEVWIHRVGNHLVVRQSAAVHRRLHAALESLQVAFEGPRMGGGFGPTDAKKP